MLPQLLLLTLSAQQLLFRGLPIKVQAGPCDEPEYCFSPKGPATLCLGEGVMQICYTAPDDYGRYPKAELIQLNKDTPAILFTAASGGVSGYSIHYSLLTQAADGKLSNRFHPSIQLTDQSQHKFFNDPSLSPSPIFVTADYHWGLNDAHHGSHRFTISVYTVQHYFDGETDRYTLTDRYMTIKRYERVDKQDDILTAEASEWKTRLRRVLKSNR